MKDLVWDKGMIEEFTAIACLTEEEAIVLNDWAYGKSITYTSMHRNMCTSKVNDIRSRLRLKYDRVQPKSKSLPPRVTSK